ncbi:MmgE/PrpD family protein [Parasphingopyxis algicola]|uniref:MmgE/PrpD family protein n=1 Tax=Parasphingopyxis algicola TaxID=2026624 RepID=UPI0015A0A457|nr:MmgE/PrpD family protein [Parasphingopyxis algicola]QLC26078.1 MmgE/PrpD family protein [Parasphingopyxis algicola]
MSEPLLAQLSERLARPVGESDRQRARLHLLDWLACVAGGRESAVSRLFARILPGYPVTAAMVSNLLEMDDVHRTALLHPGPVIWGAVFSMSSETMVGALDDAVRGYEAMIAIGAALDDHHYSHWHPTATAGVFGAAAAAGSYWDLDRDSMVWALANAGSVAGGLWHMRHDDVMTKQWHVANAIRVGNDTAWMAMDGLTGPAALLEGPQGLFEAMTQEPGPLADNGDSWLIHQVSFKPFAACRHAHPAIDAAIELRKAGELQPPFHVETYADALAFCDRPDPVTELDAKFSLQHAVAVVADGRKAEPADFTEEAIAALADLRAQVTVAEDPEITARYPAHYGVRVNGLELIDTLGDPERPVDEDAIIAKMHSLAEWGGLKASDAEKAVDVALEGDNVIAVHDLLQEWLT